MVQTGQNISSTQPEYTEIATNIMCDVPYTAPNYSLPVLATPATQNI